MSAVGLVSDIPSGARWRQDARRRGPLPRHRGVLGGSNPTYLFFVALTTSRTVRQPPHDVGSSHPSGSGESSPLIDRQFQQCPIDYSLDAAASRTARRRTRALAADEASDTCRSPRSRASRDRVRYHTFEEATLDGRRRVLKVSASPAPNDASERRAGTRRCLLLTGISEICLRSLGSGGPTRSA